jgi:hypothetical protein
MQENFKCLDAKHLGLKRFKKLPNLQANKGQSDLNFGNSEDALQIPQY